MSLYCINEDNYCNFNSDEIRWVWVEQTSNGFDAKIKLKDNTRFTLGSFETEQSARLELETFTDWLAHQN